MKFRALLILSISLLSLGAFSQTTTENRTWTKLTYRLEPAKGLDIDISGLYRTFGGEEGMDRWITELQVSKAQSKSLSFSTEFRQQRAHYRQLGR